MKRFLAAMTLGMVLVMGTVSAQAADLSVTVNGTAVTFDAQPFTEQGVTLVPMRAIMDNLGATVDWNAQTKVVTAKKDDKTVVLTIDSKVAMVNGQAVELEAAAKIVGNRTFVPVKFIGEQFGLNVEWNEANSVVSLTEITTTPAPEDKAPAENEDVTTPAEDITKVEDKDETKTEDEDTTKVEDKDETKTEDEDTTKVEDKDETKTESDDTTKVEDKDETKTESEDTAKAE